VGGELDDVKVQPALSTDVYELYRAWCLKNGFHSTDISKVVAQLVKSCGVEKHRKRYIEGMKQQQATMLIPPKSIELPPSESEQAWLGKCVSDFKSAVKGYKSGTYE
jgi:putative DNA primase/helicase